MDRKHRVMVRRVWMMHFVLLIGGMVPVVAQEPEQRFESVAKKLVQAINSEDYSSIRGDFTDGMLEVLPAEKAKEFFTVIMNHYGEIGELETPQVVAPDRAVFRAHGARRDLNITLVLDEQDKIVGLNYRPAIPVPAKLAISFHLPLEGRWSVGSDGGSPHHNSPTERFALDLIAVDESGNFHDVEGKENKDYHAFGRPILAPADGVVTDVIRGVRDNTPGIVNPSCACGNMIVFRHRAHEISVLGHLKQGSIRVEVGDIVKRGQVVALCGNSGFSFRPHLHFHVQNTPIIAHATGLPFTFEKLTVTRDGKSETKADYAPVQGDIVEQVVEEE